MVIQQAEISPDAAAVLTKAVLRAADALGLSRRRLASILGVSEATLSRAARGKGAIDPSTKEGELAMLVVRVFRSLDALVGGDDAKAKAWLNSANSHVAGTPAELMTSVTGLVGVVEYLDALRG